MDRLSDAQINWLENGPFLPATLEIRLQSNGLVHYEILDRDADGRNWMVARRHGFKGFVLKVKDSGTGSIYAAKLTAPGDYRGSKLENELAFTSKLRQAGELFLCPIQVGRCTPPECMPDASEDFICFLTPWNDGETLEDWLNNKSIEPEFACDVAIEVYKAIHFLDFHGLKHDDLHSGNVMLAPKAQGLILDDGDKNQIIVSIIDLGSLKSKDQTTSKSRNDWLSFIQILVNLYNALHRNRRVASTHPRFMHELSLLIDQLSDEDISRHFALDQDIARSIKKLRSFLDQPNIESTKFQPFEAISAEHLASDSILLELFVKTLPWMQDARENKPIVLTGPRGCGKSMIFRYLAVRTHLGSSGQTDSMSTEKPFESFGVYISCATHLQNNLSWLGRIAGRSAQRSHEIATYFQLVILRELLKALGYAQADAPANRIFRFDESGFDRLISFISKYFSDEIESGRIGNTGRILHFADDIDAVRVRLHRTLLADGKWNDLLPDTFLADVTAKLKDLLPYFTTRQVVFLLDDYSSNRVQLDIQKILNKIIFERVPSHFFKISCEKFGFRSDDIDQVQLDETREFITIDAGGKVLASRNSESSQFVKNLINRRLSVAGWKGTAELLLGSSDPYCSDIDLATQIRNKAHDQGRPAYYYGLDALGRLWSGDTATILQIVREIFSLGKVNATTTTTISKMIQHDAIVSISKQFKSRVDSMHPYGPKLADILGQFGSVIREVMLNGNANNSGKPYRLYRLEMTKDEQRETIRLLESFDNEAAEIARELLRRAIFIELEDSRGKEGPAKGTMRWELRRIFNPAFGLSLERDSYLSIKDMNKLCELLNSPRKFTDGVRASYINKVGNDFYTGSLFGENK